MRAWSKKNPERYIWNHVKQGAKQKGLEFDLEVSDIIIPKFCPILLVELCEVREPLPVRANAPSLDRIDTTKGYVKGNVAIISYAANAMKSRMSIEDIERLYMYVSKAR